MKRGYLEMKKLLLPLLALILVLAACGNQSNNESSKSKKETKTYVQDSGIK